MYVCICHAVRERDIEQAIAEGAKSVRCLKECLGVSSQCGKCAKQASHLVQTLTIQEPLQKTA